MYNQTHGTFEMSALSFNYDFIYVNGLVTNEGGISRFMHVSLVS